MWISPLEISSPINPGFAGEALLRLNFSNIVMGLHAENYSGYARVSAANTEY